MEVGETEGALLWQIKSDLQTSAPNGTALSLAEDIQDAL